MIAKVHLFSPLWVCVTLVAAGPAPAPIRVAGRYWTAPEEHRLTTRTDSYFAAGPAARELDALLASRLHTPARAATVQACALPSAPGRYGPMGRHRRMLTLVSLLRVVAPDGRVLLARPGRC